MKAGVASGSRWLRRQCGLLFLIATGWIMTGCISISAIHDPLYRAESHTSTITATAFASGTNWWGIRDIKRISITITTGQITDCPTSVIPCRREDNAVTFTHVCDFVGSPSTATCSYSQVIGDLPEHSIVTYQAEVEDGMNTERSEEITYAAGDFAAGSVARPVWVHGHPGQDIASNDIADKMPSKLDIGFFPDTGYSPLQYGEFTRDLQTMVRGAFFNAGQPFASLYTLFRKNVNLWAAPFGAHAETCHPPLGQPFRAFNFNATVVPIKTHMDGSVIVRNDSNPVENCAQIALGPPNGGAGTVGGKDLDSAKVLVHESGHFLHGQDDEYWRDTHVYQTVGNCANVFSDPDGKEKCKAAASGHGTDPANCREICVTFASGGGLITDCTGTWVNDNGQFDIMNTHLDTSAWRTDCNYCVIQRFINCATGTCY